MQGTHPVSLAFFLTLHTRHSQPHSKSMYAVLYYSYMASKVETFEHDIADEIRRKEATLAEIEAVSKQNSQNSEALPHNKPRIFLGILVALFIIALVGAGALIYYYFNDPLLPPSSESVEIKSSDIPKITAEVSKLSPTLAAEIGRFVTLVEKKDKGYVLSINNYSVVFSYMTRNESSYIEDLLLLFPGSASSSLVVPAQKPQAVSTTSPTVSTTSQVLYATTSTSTPKKTIPSKATNRTATSTATSSILTSSSSAPYNEKDATSTVLESLPPSLYKDITLSNQNMRGFASGSRVVFYAFVGDTTVLISNTPEGIISLRDAILRK